LLRAAELEAALAHRGVDVDLARAQRRQRLAQLGHVERGDAAARGARLQVQRQRGEQAQPARAEAAAAVEQRGPHDAEVATGGDDCLFAGQLAGEETAAVRMPQAQRRHVQVAQPALAAGLREQRGRAQVQAA
jgi:hypothetical protein